MEVDDDAILVQAIKEQEIALRMYGVPKEDIATQARAAALASLGRPAETPLVPSATESEYSTTTPVETATTTAATAAATPTSNVTEPKTPTPTVPPVQDPDAWTPKKRKAIALVLAGCPKLAEHVGKRGFTAGATTTTTTTGSGTETPSTSPSATVPLLPRPLTHQDLYHFLKVVTDPHILAHDLQWLRRTRQSFSTRDEIMKVLEHMTDHFKTKQEQQHVQEVLMHVPELQSYIGRNDLPMFRREREQKQRGRHRGTTTHASESEIVMEQEDLNAMLRLIPDGSLLLHILHWTQEECERRGSGYESMTEFLEALEELSQQFRGHLEQIEESNTMVEPPTPRGTIHAAPLNPEAAEVILRHSHAFIHHSIDRALEDNTPTPHFGQIVSSSTPAATTTSSSSSPPLSSRRIAANSTSAASPPSTNAASSRSFFPSTTPKAAVSSPRERFAPSLTPRSPRRLDSGAGGLVTTSPLHTAIATHEQQKQQHGMPEFTLDGDVSDDKLVSPKQQSRKTSDHDDEHPVPPQEVATAALQYKQLHHTDADAAALYVDQHYLPELPDVDISNVDAAIEAGWVQPYTVLMPSITQSMMENPEVKHIFRMKVAALHQCDERDICITGMVQHAPRGRHSANLAVAYGLVNRRLQFQVALAEWKQQREMDTQHYQRRLEEVEANRRQLEATLANERRRNNAERRNEVVHSIVWGITERAWAKILQRCQDEALEQLVVQEDEAKRSELEAMAKQARTQIDAQLMVETAVASVERAEIEVSEKTMELARIEREKQVRAQARERGRRIVAEEARLRAIKREMYEQCHGVMLRCIAAAVAQGELNAAKREEEKRIIAGKEVHELIVYESEPEDGDGDDDDDDGGDDDYNDYYQQYGKMSKYGGRSQRQIVVGDQRAMTSLQESLIVRKVDTRFFQHLHETRQAIASALDIMPQRLDTDAFQFLTELRQTRSHLNVLHRDGKQHRRELQKRLGKSNAMKRCQEDEEFGLRSNGRSRSHAKVGRDHHEVEADKVTKDMLTLQAEAQAKKEERRRRRLIKRKVNVSFRVFYPDQEHGKVGNAKDGDGDDGRPLLPPSDQLKHVRHEGDDVADAKRRAEANETSADDWKQGLKNHGEQDNGEGNGVDEDGAVEITTDMLQQQLKHDTNVLTTFSTDANSDDECEGKPVEGGNGAYEQQQLQQRQRNSRDGIDDIEFGPGMIHGGYMSVAADAARYPGGWNGEDGGAGWNDAHGDDGNHRDFEEEVKLTNVDIVNKLGGTLEDLVSPTAAYAYGLTWTQDGDGEVALTTRKDSRKASVEDMFIKSSNGGDDGNDGGGDDGNEDDDGTGWYRQGRRPSRAGLNQSFARPMTARIDRRSALGATTAGSGGAAAAGGGGGFNGVRPHSAGIVRSSSSSSSSSHGAPQPPPRYDSPTFYSQQYYRDHNGGGNNVDGDMTTSSGDDTNQSYLITSLHPTGPAGNLSTLADAVAPSGNGQQQPRSASASDVPQRSWGAQMVNVSDDDDDDDDDGGDYDDGGDDGLWEEAQELHQRQRQRVRPTSASAVMTTRSTGNRRPVDTGNDEEAAVAVLQRRHGGHEQSCAPSPLQQQQQKQRPYSAYSAFRQPSPAASQQQQQQQQQQQRTSSRHGRGVFGGYVIPKQKQQQHQQTKNPQQRQHRTRRTRRTHQRDDHRSGHNLYNIAGTSRACVAAERARREALVMKFDNPRIKQLQVRRTRPCPAQGRPFPVSGGGSGTTAASHLPTMNGSNEIVVAAPVASVGTVDVLNRVQAIHFASRSRRIHGARGGR